MFTRPHTRGSAPSPRAALLVSICLLGLIHLGAATPLSAENFCVSSSDELRNALSISPSNGETDTIRVVQGIYPTGGDVFDYITTEDFDLILLGGYTAGCGDRELDPTNTILDGAGSSPVMRLLPINNSGGDLLIQGFTIQNGFAPGNWRGGGLSIGGTAGYHGDVTVDHNIFIENHAAYYGSALTGGSDTGTTRIVGNLIAGNSTDLLHAASLTAHGDVYITNNTVTGNTAAAGDGGLRLGGGGAVTLAMSNNILHGNTEADLILDTSNVLLAHNDIGTQHGTGAPGSTGNMSVDPLFVGGGDCHLLSSSELVNAGLNTPEGGLPLTDLDGQPRIHGGVVDMGAYEYSGPNAVLVTAFAAEPRVDAVLLTWRTGFESRHLGFHVRRAPAAAGTPGGPAADAPRITPALIEPPSPYAFLDSNVEPGASYAYWLEAIDLTGTNEFVGPLVAGPDRAPAGVPGQFALAQCVPNPVSATDPRAEISFVLAEPAAASLSIFDVSGRLTRRLVHGWLPAGPHRVTWDGRDERGAEARSAVYFYRLEVGESALVRRLVRVK